MNPPRAPALPDPIAVLPSDNGAEAFEIALLRHTELAAAAAKRWQTAIEAARKMAHLDGPAADEVRAARDQYLAISKEIDRLLSPWMDRRA